MSDQPLWADAALLLEREGDASAVILSDGVPMFGTGPLSGPGPTEWGPLREEARTAHLGQRWLAVAGIGSPPKFLDAGVSWAVVSGADYWIAQGLNEDVPKGVQFPGGPVDEFSFHYPR